MSNLYSKLKDHLFLLAGPCVVEPDEIMDLVAESLLKLSEKFDVPIVYKASFDKANRTSVSSFRGPGMDEGLEKLHRIKEKYGFSIITDIHESWQAEKVTHVADILQIPAFLCRQTDLLLAAGETGKIVNVKKGQFLSGPDMAYAVRKIESTGNKQIMLTERGNMFGYNNLVVDYRNLVDMAEFGYPVVMDVTHAVQKPGGAGGKSGGNREYVPYIARAAAAVGVHGFFFEVHPEPDQALSDGPNMITPSQLEKIVNDIISIKKSLQ